MLVPGLWASRDISFVRYPVRVIPPSHLLDISNPYTQRLLMIPTSQSMRFRFFNLGHIASWT